MESVEGLQLPREDLDLKLQLILANITLSTTATINFPPPVMWQLAMHVFLEQLAKSL